MRSSFTGNLTKKRTRGFNSIQSERLRGAHLLPPALLATSCCVTLSNHKHAQTATTTRTTCLVHQSYVLSFPVHNFPSIIPFSWSCSGFVDLCKSVCTILILDQDTTRELQFLFLAFDFVVQVKNSRLCSQFDIQGRDLDQSCWTKRESIIYNQKKAV